MGDYGLFNLLALYLTNSTESGALGFSQVEKGMMMGIVNAILYFLPVITGSIADKFGYKKVLVVAFAILASGYFLMGYVTSFASVFITFFYVAIGAALFKPIISATIAKTTNEKNSSLGFGIFYMIINVGGLIGPVMASELRQISWHYVFLMSSSSILVNMVIVLFFYKEPDRTKNSDSLKKSLKIIFQNIFNVLKDLRFTLFLVIIIGAWTVYWQYFYSLPVFIEQWTDTSLLYNWLYKIWPGFAIAVGTDEGIILAEKIIALDALIIIIFQLVISTVISRIKPMHSMTVGILINSLGLSLAVITRNPFFLISSIFIFSVGEMIFSPKILEYIGNIAPNDKAALYMGTQFLPIAFGNFFGGFISGGVYNNLANRTRMTRELLSGNPGTDLSLEQLSVKAMDQLGMNYQELTDHLWNLNNPGKFGIVLASIGFATFLALLIYDKYFFAKKS